MKLWKCAECNSKALTITAYSDRIVMMCEKCGDGRYVKR